LSGGKKMNFEEFDKLPVGIVLLWEMGSDGDWLVEVKIGERDTLVVGACYDYWRMGTNAFAAPQFYKVAPFSIAKMFEVIE